MIYEYALDPSLVAQWHDRKEYLFFEEKFGINTRRMVSIYPKSKWRMMVWKAFETSDCSDIEKQNGRLRLDALIRELSKDTVQRISTFGEIASWIERAEKEHAERPFRAIITNKTDRTNPAVIEATNLVTNGHNLWDVPGLPTVPRRASDMAEYIAPVLRVCRHVIFIDPYFNPDKKKFKHPLEIMLEKTCEFRDTSEQITIELHTGIERFFKSPYSPPRTKENEQQECSKFLQTCHEKLPGIVPANIKLKIVVWKERPNGQRLHNRFVLTELIGIIFGTGLDESSNPDSESTDIVMLLSKEQREECWKQYSSLNPAFDYAGEPVEIVGQKT